MKNYLKLIRVNHWLKNGLVFLPLFFNGNLFYINKLILAIIAFIIFCMSSSIVYIINDASDIEKDKKHPIKKNRPLASGAINIKQAYIVELFLLIILVLCMCYLFYINNNIFTFIIPFVYIFLNIIYSKGLKNIAIIDVVILASGFLFRCMYGGVAVGIEVSKYLYLMIIFGSFYLGFGKRRGEMLKNGNKSRNVLKQYNKDFLDKNMYVSFSLAIVSYVLWCVDPVIASRVGHDYMFWTIPILMVILQLYSLDIEKDSFGDPVDVILNDKVLLFTILIYMSILLLLLYVI